jgi:hypothetical protein
MMPQEAIESIAIAIAMSPLRRTHQCFANHLVETYLRSMLKQCLSGHEQAKAAEMPL